MYARTSRFGLHSHRAVNEITKYRRGAHPALTSGERRGKRIIITITGHARQWLHCRFASVERLYLWFLRYPPPWFRVRFESSTGRPGLVLYTPVIKMEVQYPLP